jgi:hypothetical protein
MARVRTYTVWTRTSFRTMTLVTTMGAADADSYATVAEADAYFLARGVTTWTGTDVAKENALRRGTNYLDNQYRGRWCGYRTFEVQALAWPRIGEGQAMYTYSNGRGFWGLIDLDGFPIDPQVVPTQVKNAAIEASLLALSGATLEPTLVRGNQIKSESKAVGPLRKDVVYMDGAPSVDRYTVIEGLLRGLVNSTPGASSGVMQVVRG